MYFRMYLTECIVEFIIRDNNFLLSFKIITHCFREIFPLAREIESEKESKSKGEIHCINVLLLHTLCKHILL